MDKNVNLNSSRNHIDSWIRKNPTHFLNTGKFTSLTDLYNQGAAADVLNVVEFSHKEPQYGIPILSQYTALKSYLAATQKPYETPAAFSERLDELSSCHLALSLPPNQDHP